MINNVKFPQHRNTYRETEIRKSQLLGRSIVICIQTAVGSNNERF